MVITILVSSESGSLRKPVKFHSRRGIGRKSTVTSGRCDLFERLRNFGGLSSPAVHELVLVAFYFQRRLTRN